MQRILLILCLFLSAILALLMMGCQSERDQAGTSGPQPAQTSQSDTGAGGPQTTFEQWPTTSFEPVPPTVPTETTMLAVSADEQGLIGRWNLQADPSDEGRSFRYVEFSNQPVRTDPDGMPLPETGGFWVEFFDGGCQAHVRVPISADRGTTSARGTHVPLYRNYGCDGLPGGPKMVQWLADCLASECRYKQSGSSLTFEDPSGSLTARYTNSDVATESSTSGRSALRASDQPQALLGRWDLDVTDASSDGPGNYFVDLSTSASLEPTGGASDGGLRVWFVDGACNYPLLGDAELHGNMITAGALEGQIKSVGESCQGVPEEAMLGWLTECLKAGCEYSIEEDRLTFTALSGALTASFVRSDDAQPMPPVPGSS
jgi:hypothetical protein